MKFRIESLVVFLAPSAALAHPGHGVHQALDPFHAALAAAIGLAGFGLAAAIARRARR